jgi:hypothetical protein
MTRRFAVSLHLREAIGVQIRDLDELRRDFGPKSSRS